MVLFIFKINILKIFTSTTQIKYHIMATYSRRNLICQIANHLRKLPYYNYIIIFQNNKPPPHLKWCVFHSQIKLSLIILLSLHICQWRSIWDRHISTHLHTTRTTVLWFIYYIFDGIKTSKYFIFENHEHNNLHKHDHVWKSFLLLYILFFENHMSFLFAMITVVLLVCYFLLILWKIFLILCSFSDIIIFSFLFSNSLFFLYALFRGKVISNPWGCHLGLLYLTLLNSF